MVKKANREYWKKRFEALEDKQYQESEAYYRDVEEQFRKVCNGLTLDTEKAKWNKKPEIFFGSGLPETAPAGSVCFLI